MRFALVALVAVVALAACGDGGTATPAAVGDCVPASWAASGSAVPGSAVGSTAGGEPLADLALACFPGGGDIRLARLGVPAVVNLWASWCDPCRKELPAFERFAGKAGERVRVVGVITGTPRSAAQSVVDDLGLTFPMLYDREQALLRAVRRINLPVTLFLDPSGRVAYLYSAAVLDAGTIERLTEQHLGVKLPT